MRALTPLRRPPYAPLSIHLRTEPQRAQPTRTHALSAVRIPDPPPRASGPRTGREGCACTRRSPSLESREVDAPMTSPSHERDAILRRAAELGASDLLITAGHPVMVTVAGMLQPLADSTVLSEVDSRRLVESFLTPALFERFQRDLELDTRCMLEGVASFRVNCFVQRGAWGAAVRIVPLRIPLPGDLGLAPHVVSRLLAISRGLVLVTGPTGAGKSTTIASILEQINSQGPRRHIVTVEDPIEFIFQAKQAVIDQREVGTDTRSY